MPGPRFEPIPANEMAGAIVVYVFAILSTVLLSSIFVRMIWLGVLRLLQKNVTEAREYIFFNTQLGYYAANLLIANMVNGVAGLMGLPSVFERGIREDDLCRSQALVMQIGNIASAYFTVAIAVHTFNSLVLRKRQPALLYSIGIAGGWILSAVLATLPLYISQPQGPIYGISGLACGIRAIYPKQQFFLHVFPIFITAVSSALLYSFIFLVLRGTLVIKGGVRLQFNPRERWGGQRESYHRFVLGIIRSMIWFPVAYIAFLVPYSVTRLLVLSGFQVPFQALVLAFTLWFMLGVVNALLFYNTFRVLGPAFGSLHGTSVQRLDTEKGPNGDDNQTSSPISVTEQGHFSPLMSAKFSPLSSPILLRYPEAVATPESISIPSIPQNISRNSLLNQSIVVYPRQQRLSPRSSPRIPRSPQWAEHSRAESDTSIVSLPAPPRRTVSRKPVFDPAGGASPVVPPVVRSPALANPSRVLSSTGSMDLDIAGWLAKQSPDGSMPRGLKNQLLAPTAAQSRPEISSPSRLRPLVLVPSPTESPTTKQFGMASRGVRPSAAQDHFTRNTSTSSQTSTYI